MPEWFTVHGSRRSVRVFVPNLQTSSSITHSDFQVRPQISSMSLHPAPSSARIPTSIGAASTPRPSLTSVAFSDLFRPSLLPNWNAVNVTKYQQLSYHYQMFLTHGFCSSKSSYQPLSGSLTACWVKFKFSAGQHSWLQAAFCLPPLTSCTRPYLGQLDFVSFLFCTIFPASLTLLSHRNILLLLSLNEMSLLSCLLGDKPILGNPTWVSALDREHWLIHFCIAGSSMLPSI